MNKRINTDAPSVVRFKHIPTKEASSSWTAWVVQDLGETPSIVQMARDFADLDALFEGR